MLTPAATALSTSASSPQRFDINNLLNGLGRQLDRILCAHTDAILNPHRQAPEMLRPPLIIHGDIDTRLNRDTLALLEQPTPRHTGRVVDIQADKMANVVRKQRLDGAALRHVEAEVAEGAGEEGAGLRVQLVEREARRLAAQGQQRRLHAQHRAVEVAEGGREDAIVGPCARYIGDVAAVGAARVDEDAVVGTELISKVSSRGRGFWIRGQTVSYGRCGRSGS